MSARGAESGARNILAVPAVYQAARTVGDGEGGGGAYTGYIPSVLTILAGHGSIRAAQVGQISLTDGTS